MIKLISKKYIQDDTGITFTIDLKGWITISNKDGDKEFIFQNSHKNVVKKVGEALLQIANYAEELK